MKTFGDLQEGDIIIMYNLIRFVTRKITAITKDGPKTRIILLEGCRWPFRAEKSLSTQTQEDINVYFSCNEAAEDYLWKRAREENERHSREIKTIQELREQYESVRS